MDTFGYNILRALVTDIVPDAKVKAAMNDINAAQREQIAAQARGEADKILKVKQAEAEAESKALQGDGVARQRQAIIKGLQASVEQFQKAVGGASATRGHAVGDGYAVFRHLEVDRRERPIPKLKVRVQNWLSPRTAARCRSILSASRAVMTCAPSSTARSRWPSVSR